ncbi:MAG: 16S rRNA (uracil(1498)-N(3))-methyltransferase [Pseudomonadota bacterium]
MRTTRLFHDTPLSADSAMTLDGTAAHYLGRVLRARVGHTLELFDGSGQVFEASITALSRREVSLAIGQSRPGLAPSPCRVTLWQALSRNEKMDWVMQKAVELGVSALQPVTTEHSTAAPVDEKLGKRMAHWQAVIIGAAQQCGRSELPALGRPASLAAAPLAEADSLNVFAHPGAPVTLTDVLSDTTADSITLAVGPEGGFSESDTAALRDRDFTAVSAGPRILRTETAAISLLAAIQAARGDWSRQHNDR